MYVNINISQKPKAARIYQAIKQDLQYDNIKSVQGKQFFILFVDAYIFSKSKKLNGPQNGRIYLQITYLKIRG